MGILFVRRRGVVVAVVLLLVLFMALVLLFIMTIGIMHVHGSNMVGKSGPYFASLVTASG